MDAQNLAFVFLGFAKCLVEAVWSKCVGVWSRAGQNCTIQMFDSNHDTVCFL